MTSENTLSQLLPLSPNRQTNTLESDSVNNCSQNSSIKCEKYRIKRRHHSSGNILHNSNNSSDSEEKDVVDDKCIPRKSHYQKQQPSLPKAERSGYLSSNESNAEEQQPDTIPVIKHSSPTEVPTIEQSRSQLRLHVMATTSKPIYSTKVNKNRDIAEWEIIDQSIGKESDVSWTGNESSDEFWKGSTDGTAAASLVPKSKKQKRQKSKTKSSLWFWQRNEITNKKKGSVIQQLSSARAEWKALKLEYVAEIEHIRHIRNKCLIGLLLIFIFCGIGGVIFHSVEGAFEMFYKCGVKRVKRDFIDTLWTKSHYMREDEWKSIARGKLMEFENQLYDAYEAGMTTYSGQKGWSFLNSFVYCLTLVTTIGYGHIAPATTIGRIITIIYSLFGIPLFLILLADCGKLFTLIIKFFWMYVKRLSYTSSCRKVEKNSPEEELVETKKISSTKVQESNLTCPISPLETPTISTYTIDDEFNLPITVAISILLVYILSGTALFMQLEKWSFFESFYFVYISVSTIGFGDIVPSSRISVLICSLLYFVFGLSLTSMCINVITEKLTDSFQQATEKIGTIVGMEVVEDPVKPNSIYDE